MSKLLTTLIEKCSVAVEFGGGNCRIMGTGLVGILGVIGILALIVQFAPQFVSLFSIR
jgi:hypothetical protein